MSSPNKSRLIADKLAEVASAVSDLNRSIQQEILTVRRRSSATFSVCPLTPENYFMGASSHSPMTSPTLPKNEGYGQTRPCPSGGEIEVPVGGQINPCYQPKDCGAVMPFVESRFYWGPMNEIPPTFFERSENYISRSLTYVNRKLCLQSRSESIDLSSQIKENGQGFRKTSESSNISHLSFEQEEQVNKEEITDSAELAETFHPAMESLDEEIPSQEFGPWTKDEFVVNTLAVILEKLDAIERRLTHNKTNN